VIGVRPGLLGLLACVAAAWAQAPTPEQTGAAIEMSRKVALAYTSSLPDFICAQLVYRYVDVAHPRIPSWRALDTLTIQLTYFDQREDHKLLLVDGKPSEKSYADLSGALSVGEFALLHRQIFDPASQTTFTWQKWTNVGKRRASVYLYRVDVSRSQYSLNFRSSAGLTQAIVGYHGVVEVDRETGDLLSLTCIADAIPKTCPINLSTMKVTYDLADVGGRQYLLPASSELEMHSRELRARNQARYRNYRKFSADSAVHFGDAK
jgi:hypothetical protein